VQARLINAAPVVEAMTLCEAQGMRLKAHGKAIIQLKPSLTLRLLPSAFCSHPLASGPEGEKWPWPEPGTVVHKKRSMPTHLNVTKMLRIEELITMERCKRGALLWPGGAWSSCHRSPVPRGQRNRCDFPCWSAL